MQDLLSVTTVLDGATRAVRNIGRAVQSIQAHGVNTPILDPLGMLNAFNTDLGARSIVEYGFIADAIPGIRQYRVMPEGGGPLIACTAGMHCAGSTVGVYDATTLVSGTYVRYMRHRQTPMEGVILAIEPSYHADPRLMYADVISQGSNTGIHLETGYHALLKMGGSTGSIAHNGGLVNYGGRSPWDSLEVGELNYSTETGLMLHMDPYMAFLRADELTGIWVFYWDGLTRIGGQHLQEITSVSTREVYDDEGEVSMYRGVAGYPWENRGMLLAPSDTLTTENVEPQITQTDKPYYARLEPKHTDQQAFHRFQTYEGYLGQGEKKVISIPKRDSGYSTNVYRYSDKTYQNIGLFDAQATAAGHYFIRSALGITIAKRPLIPVPKRVKIVTDQNTTDPGDMHGNYKFSSLFTDGAAGLRDHKIQPSPTPASVAYGEPLLHTATAVLDIHAHMFNWEGLHPFYYHQKDYFIPEENAYTQTTTNNQEIPTWSKLNDAGQWYLSPSTTKTVTIDHRTLNEAKIYQNTSYITLLDDGGVLIGGGYGEEIRMVGGSIFLSCPGDVFTEAGRNIIGWAGRDHISRAWNSVDITANGGGSTQGGDVRLKAERNMQLISANNKGPYGTFIENRADAPAQYDFRGQGEACAHTGIIVSAKNTEICMYADNMYFRTCPPDSTVQAVGSGPRTTIPKHGDITLDASDGTPSGGCGGDITTRSRNIKHWVRCAIMHSFNINGEHSTSQGVNIFTKEGETLCNPLYVDSSITARYDVTAGRDIAAVGQLYSTAGCLQKLAGTNATTISTALSDKADYEVALLAWADSQYSNDFINQWYYEGRPGDNDTIQSMWTSLRTDSDYYCAAFTLFESRWAQMARSNTSAPKKWSEHSVSTNVSSNPTYPFPGGQRLVTDSAYKTHQYKLYSAAAQRAVDRGGVYEAPVSLLGPAASVIDGNYPIIGK